MNHNDGINSSFSGSSFTSTLLFSWISPLLAYGNRYQINEESFPILDDDQQPDISYNRLSKAFAAQPTGQARGWALVKSMLIAFKKEFIFVAWGSLLLAALSIIQPILMN